MSTDDYIFLMWSMDEKPVRTAIHQHKNQIPVKTNSIPTSNDKEYNTNTQIVSHDMHKDEYEPNPKTVDREKISDNIAQRLPMAQFTMNPFIQSNYLQDLDNQEKFLKPLNSSYSKDTKDTKNEYNM